MKLEELKKIDRFREPSDSGLMSEMLWVRSVAFLSAPASAAISVTVGVAILLCRYPPLSVTLRAQSDPQPLPGRIPSKRGVGIAFGPDVTERFLRDNDLGTFSLSHCHSYHGHTPPRLFLPFLSIGIHI